MAPNPIKNKKYKNKKKSYGFYFAGTGADRGHAGGSAGLEGSRSGQTGCAWCPKPYELIGFGNIDGPKPHQLIRFGNIYGPNAYKLIGFGNI